jgi:hypothetical protein
MTDENADKIRHFLAWIPHKRPNSAPPLEDTSSIIIRAFRPTAHVTGQLALKRQIRVGDVIWLAGNFRQLGRPEGALDGRIVVSCVRREEEKLVFEAADDSAWIPWMDATELLYSCRFGSSGAVALKPDKSLGQQLRFTRRVSPQSAAKLEKFAASALQKPLFISYRWCDASDVVAKLLPKLATEGHSVWWDHWSGPRRLMEERAPPPELADMLTRAIKRAAGAVIVLSPAYHQGKWAAHEYDRIKRLGIPKVEVDVDELRSATWCSTIRRALTTLQR